MVNSKYLLSLLEKLGLTESEAKFYLLVLKKPDLTVREVQVELGFSLAKTYRIFDKLKEMNMIFASANNWKQSLTALSLRRLSEKIDQEQRQLGKLSREIKDISGIQSFYLNSNAQEPVRIITDYAEMSAHKMHIVETYEGLLKCYGAVDRLQDLVGPHVENCFVKNRVRSGKKAVAIFSELGDYAKELLPKNDLELRTVKIAVDSNKQDCMVYTYQDGVTVWSKDKDLGNRAIVISDPVLVKMYHQNFDSMWSRV